VHLEERPVQVQVVDAGAGKVAAAPGVELGPQPLADPADGGPADRRLLAEDLDQRRLDVAVGQAPHPAGDDQGLQRVGPGDTLPEQAVAQGGVGVAQLRALQLDRPQFARAEALLRGSVEAAESAGEGTVVVDALEALAAVLSAEDRPREAAVRIGAAAAQRGSASSSRRPPQPPDEDLCRSLMRELGGAVFDKARTEGRSLSPTQALEITTSAPPAGHPSSP
jgi:hypothetical protein